jgi:ABC-type uncharacterized transport system ATPase component
MGYWALINSGVVISVIVADKDFIDLVGSNGLGCDTVVEIPTDDSRPGPGFLYNGKEFTSPE